MRFRKGFEEKSRLGRLLVNRGYMTEGQVEEGLRQQRESGKRLGEVFIAAGWITERELGRVLKHQSRYRSAAAVFTMVTLPFQPLVTFAASNNANAAQMADTGELFDAAGMSPLTDEELSAAAGQGGQRLFDRISLVSNMAESSESGENDSQPEPERIEEIRMDNIRVSGGGSPAMGNVSIQNIRFHPDSRMTIYTR